MGHVSVRTAPDGQTYLAKAIDQRSISLHALARESDLAVNTVKDLMLGRRAPRLTTARKVTAAFHRLACPLPELDDLFTATDGAGGQSDGARP